MIPYTPKDSVGFFRRGGMISLVLLSLFLFSCASGNDLIDSNHGGKSSIADEIETGINLGFQPLAGAFDKWFDGMENTVNDSHTETAEMISKGLTGMSNKIDKMDTTIKGIDAQIGNVQQTIGKFQGEQNTGIMSGGAIYLLVYSIITTGIMAYLLKFVFWYKGTLPVVNSVKNAADNGGSVSAEQVKSAVKNKLGKMSRYVFNTMLENRSLKA